MTKSFVLRFRCPYGDAYELRVLENRGETLREILDTPWEFECPLHGVQREMPVDAIEKRMSSASIPQRNELQWATSATPSPRSSSRISLHIPVTVWSKGEASFQEETTTLLVNSNGGLVTLASKVGLGDKVFVVNGTTQEEQECCVAYLGPELAGKARVGVAFKYYAPSFWRNNRKESRSPKSLRVWVRGLDRNGQQFVQSASTVDVSRNGAGVDGIGFVTGCGKIVQVSRRWRKARFRVVWVGEIGRPHPERAGLLCLEPNKNFWGIR